MDHAKGVLRKQSGREIKSGKATRKNISRKFQGKTVLSIDIGQHTTKLVLGRSIKPTVEVKQAVTFQTPHGSIESGRIHDINELAAQISHVIDAEKMRANYVFCTMEDSEIITREIILPTVQDATMENMLQFEVQQYMPVDLDNYIIQSKVLDSFDDNGVDKTRFLTTAVPKDLIQGYFDLMQKINLKAAVLDIQSNSAGKLLLWEYAAAENSAMQDNDSIAVVDFGYNHINVILIKDGKYQFNRYITQGAESIDRSFMNVLGYSEEEIEQKKHNGIDLSTSLSMPDDPHGNVDGAVLRDADIIKNVIDNWVDELERVFKYYASRSKEKTVQKILIHGGVTQIAGFGDYLSKVLGIPVERVQTLRCVKLQDSSIQDITPYLNAIGAFIRS